MTTCNNCGEVLEIGSWPFCGDHSKVEARKGFEPYEDWNISDKPVTISNPGDRNKYLRPHWENDQIVHIQPKERSSEYMKDLRARREARREQAIKEGRTR